MKNSNFVFLAIALFVVIACEKKTDTAADIEANKKLVELWDETMRAGDTDAMLELYVDNPVRLMPNEPIFQGRERVRSSFQTFFNENEYNYVSKIEDIIIAGDYAIIRGSYTGSHTEKASGQTVSDVGKWVEIHQRQADGSWKVMYDIENSDFPIRALNE